MLSRALSLATVTLLIGCLTAMGARAVENLEAGKSPSQIFSGTCSACHKSPRGLLRDVPASSLQSFLRQHYTTSGDMASVLASFLISNGAADTRFQAKQGKDAAKDGRQQEAARPSDQPAEPRNTRRLPRQGETPDLMRPDGGPVQAAIDTKQGTKQKQGRKGRPGEEPPKVEEPAKMDGPAEAAKTETPKETAKGDDSAKPEAKSETAKVDAAKDTTKDTVKDARGEPTPARADPVPAVTPAPGATVAAPAASTTVSSAPPDAATGSSAPPVQAAEPAPAAVAAVPSLPPVPPAGPPAPPISQ